jgi:TRAP-type mannitol/chloroaromatic compound transport system permease small subunit
MWLAVLLVLVQFAVVVLRYAFGTSFIMMQESVIYLHATLFMLAIGYTFLVDQHVRVDVLYARWSGAAPRAGGPRGHPGRGAAVLRARALGVLGLRRRVLAQDEGPMAVGGLPLVPALKSLIPLMAVLLALQAVSIAIRCVAVLPGRPTTHLPHRAHQGSA